MNCIFLFSDVEQPSITCPGNIETTTLHRQPHGVVNWEEPTVDDNSKGEDPLAELTVTSNFQPSDKFDIGRHKVTYVVRDSANLQKDCYFYVEVKGKD